MNYIILVILDFFRMSTIESLPTEILFEIFDNVNYEDLKNLCLVSTYWNEIISNSKKFWNETKLRVKLDGSNDVKLSRNYQWLEIIGDRQTDQLVESIISEISDVAEFFKTVKISNLTISEQDFINLIRCCTTIEELEIQDVKLNFDSALKNSNFSVVKLPPLLKFTVKCSDSLLNYLQCCELKYLFIDRDEDQITLEQEHVIDFLNKIDRLDTLILSGFNMESYIELQPKFYWKHLKVSDVFLPEMSVSRKNWKHLINSADDDAKVSFEYLFSHEFLLNFFNDFDNMKKFKFDVNILPEADNEIFIRDLRKMIKVKHLKIRRLSTNAVDMNMEPDDRVNYFLEKFPNVEHLDFDFASVPWFTTELIPVCFGKVKHLTVERFTEEMKKFIFPNLESLEIKSFSTDDCIFMLTFGRNNIKLKRFKANLVEMFRFYGSLTFLRLSMYMFNVEMFELFDLANKKNFIKSRADIELSEFGKVLSSETRNKLERQLLDQEE